jgi:hypothetical protein
MQMHFLLQVNRLHRLLLRHWPRRRAHLRGHHPQCMSTTSLQILRRTRTSPANCSVTSIVVFLGRLVTATLSSSVTPNKRRCARTTTPTPMLHHLLLGFLRLYPPLSPTTLMHPMGCKMIVVTAAHPIRCKMIVVMVKMESTLIRLPRQRGQL